MTPNSKISRLTQSVTTRRMSGTTRSPMTPRITNPNSKRRCASDREFLKEVESKAKKPKKEETAPKRPMSKDEKAEKKHEKEFSVEVYVEVAVPRRR